MGLLKCHDCGGKVSSSARTCPHCGAPVERMPPPRQKNSFLTSCLLWTIVLPAILLAGFCVIGNALFPPKPLTEAEKKLHDLNAKARRAKEAAAEAEARIKAAEVQAAEDAKIVAENAKVAAAEALLRKKREEEKAETQRRLERAPELFLARLKTAKIDGSLVRSVSAADGEITIVVANNWHALPYQIRLQGAQNFYRAWLDCSGLADADAGISIVDLNGNRVGGDGAFGVWVQK